MASRSVQERLHTAFSFVRGQETNRSISSLTLDHLLQERIDAIEGGESRNLLDAAGATTSKRPSKLAQLDDMEKAIDDVVKAFESEETA